MCPMLEQAAMRLLLSILAVVMMLFATTAIHAQEAVKIGDRIGKLKFTDIRSLPRSLDDFGAKKALVLVFTNTSCPVVQRYMPTLQALANEYSPKGVAIIAVNAAEEDSLIA